MNITAKSSKLILLKLILLVTFSLLYHTSVNAEDSLYERGKELVALKEYEKAIKAFELASKTGSLDALTALGVMHIGGIGVEQDNTKGYKYIIQLSLDCSNTDYSNSRIHFLTQNYIVLP